MTCDEAITWGERSALMEYLGGLSRAEAERRATKIMAGTENEPEQLKLL